MDTWYNAVCNEIFWGCHTMQFVACNIAKKVSPCVWALEAGGQGFSLGLSTGDYSDRKKK